MSSPAEPTPRNQFTTDPRLVNLLVKVSAFSLVVLAANHACDAVVDFVTGIFNPGASAGFSVLCSLLTTVTLTLLARYISNGSSASPRLRNAEKRKLCDLGQLASAKGVETSSRQDAGEVPECLPRCAAVTGDSRPAAKANPIGEQKATLKAWRAKTNTEIAKHGADKGERESRALQGPQANVTAKRVTSAAGKVKQVSAAFEWLEIGHVKKAQEEGPIASQAPDVVSPPWRKGDVRDSKRKSTRICDANSLQCATAARKKPPHAEDGPYKGERSESHADGQLNSQAETVPDPWVAGGDPWSTAVRNRSTQAKTKTAYCSEYKPRSDASYAQRAPSANLRYPAPSQPWLAWGPSTWDSSQSTLICLLCQGRQVSDVDGELSDDYSGLHGALSMHNQVGHRKKMENLEYWMTDPDYWGYIAQERRKYHPDATTMEKVRPASVKGGEPASAEEPEEVVWC